MHAIECDRDIAPFNALFNASRFIDDIGIAGIPHGVNVLALLSDTRADRSAAVTTPFSASDGIYPHSFTDDEGNVTINPMEVNVEQAATHCTYLDMRLQFKPGHRFVATVHQKRDGMPVFSSYRRFPHKDSRIATRTKYNVFTSQMHRFAAICTGWSGFRLNVKRLLKEMITHGYKWSLLRSMLRAFWPRYAKIQLRVHNQTVCHARKMFGKLTWDCGALVRRLKR